MTIKQVYTTGYGVIVGSLLLTVLSLAYSSWIMKTTNCSVSYIIQNYSFKIKHVY